MLDGLKKNEIDRVWNAVARPLARAGLAPNQITWIGLVLVLVNCLLYLHHRDNFWFGLGLAAAFAFDALDGAVAREQGSASKYGGYLDAVIDRYQEMLAYAAIGAVTGWWGVVFFAATGSFLISYNKARTAMEIPIQNHAWPDLLERFERIVILCTALVFDSLFALPQMLGESILHAALLVLAVLTHFTAIQRFIRARAMLVKQGEGGGR